MAVFLLNHCWATGPPWSPHSECKALTSIDIVIPRVFFRSLGSQSFCLSEVENCILPPWVPSDVTSRKAFFMFGCPLLLVDVEPSELVLNPKTGYVSAAQRLWLTCHLILFRLSLTVSFTAISPVQALICYLYCSLEEKLPWCTKTILNLLGNTYDFPVWSQWYFTLWWWGCSESACLTKAKLHLIASWERGLSKAGKS